MKRSGSVLLFALILSCFVAVRPARAVSIGDAALTVSITTVSGAILGASTLPFYSESGKHTKNIFYGAAFGAVAGVIIAAYAGVREADEEEVLRRKERDFHFALERQLKPERSTAIAQPGENAMGQVLVWSPLAKLYF